MFLMTPRRRALMWTLLAIAAALLCLVVFQGYLRTEMLLNFANSFFC